MPAMDPLRTRLEANAAQFGLALDDEEWTRLAVLRDLWIRYGRSMNLTGAQSALELAPHITEALQVVALARRLGLDRAEVRWLDVGAGAGFPGLVVAACLEVGLTLMEPRERRAGFLELALAAIGRPSRVLRGHLGVGTWSAVRGGSSLEGGFDVAGARAVFAPSAWIEVGRSWVRPGGIVFAHLTVDDSASCSEKWIDCINFDRWSICALRV